MQDKLTLINGIGGALASGGDEWPLEKLVETAIDGLRPPSEGTRRDLATAYVTRLVEDEEFRTTETIGPPEVQHPGIMPESVVTQLKPQDEYSTETLVQFVKTDPRFEKARPEYLDALQNDSLVAKDSLSHLLHEAQVFYYREPPRIWRLHGDDGVLSIVSNELTSQLIHSGALNPEDNKGAVRRAVNIVSSELFAVKNARESGPMDHHAYHVAILGRCRRRIQDAARSRLVREGVLANMARVVLWNGPKP
jgi:hypothetical protein